MTNLSEKSHRQIYGQKFMKITASLFPNKSTYCWQIWHAYEHQPDLYNFSSNVSEYVFQNAASFIHIFSESQCIAFTDFEVRLVLKVSAYSPFIWYFVLSWRSEKLAD